MKVLTLIVGTIVLSISLYFVVRGGGQAQSKPPEIFRSMHHGQPMSLTIFHKPCTNKDVLAALEAHDIRDELIPQFQAAELQYDGENYASCWLDHQGKVYSFDEKGSPLVPMPRKDFKPLQTPAPKPACGYCGALPKAV